MSSCDEPETLSITEAQLVSALHEWEIGARTGKCLTVEQHKEMSASEAATLSAQHLWAALRALQAK